MLITVGEEEEEDGVNENVCGRAVVVNRRRFNGGEGDSIIIVKLSSSVLLLQLPTE